MSAAGVRVLRRSFLVGLGLATGGLALGVFVPEARALAPAGDDGDGVLRPNAFVHVARDGKITIACARSEMGQGVRSSLPVIVADEMDADMARVTVVQADGDRAYGDQNTDGSSSVRGKLDDLRRVGAVARVMLVAAAAKRWGVATAACRADGHAVVHTASRRSLGFGDLAGEAAKLPVPKLADVPLRPRSELRHVGAASLPLLDGLDIVTGRAVYGADVKLPGMLTAVCVRPPVVGGELARHDDRRALAVQGVKRVVELPAPKGAPGMQPLGGLAVVATDTWSAMRGCEALDVGWSAGENATYDSAAYREELLAAVRAPGKVARNVGDAERALASAARRVEAEYYVPHLAHASMEPPVALARFGADGSCEVWAPTQSPMEARTEVAKALGLDPAKVTVHVTLLGGAFGRKAKHDFVVEAALCSRAMNGAPVRVQWTREDDVRHDYFHTVSAQRLEAGLDASGKIVAWRHRTAYPPIAATFRKGVEYAGTRDLGQGILDLPLAIPNVRAENGGPVHAHTRIGWLRSVNNIHHAFAVGSFVDELAHARGEDPRDTLLEIIGPPRRVSAAELGVDGVPNYGAPIEEHPVDAGRLRRVIERVTELSRWTESRRAGRALGLHAHRSFLSYVAVVASVVSDARDGVRVDEAWVVADAGTIVNPDRARAQMEGAFVFAASHALHGAVTMKNGAVQQTNFRDYRILRMPEAPRRVNVELIASDAPPGGVGEPGVPPVAPAIANAVFALTGKRVRDLPLRRSS